MVSRFALDDIVFRAAVARFSHSSLGALRILAHFSTSRRLLDGLGSYGVVLDPSLWCSFVSPQRVHHEYRDYDARLYRLYFALVRAPLAFSPRCRASVEGARRDFAVPSTCAFVTHSISFFAAYREGLESVKGGDVKDRR